MDRIVSMILNRLLRRTVMRGVDAGINMATRGRGEEDLSPDQQQAGRQTAQRARQMTRLAQRFTRF